MDPGPQIEPTIPCNLCGAQSAYVISQIDRDLKPLRSVICERCGLVWTDPRPTTDEIHGYYSEQYRQDYKGAALPKAKHIHRAVEVAALRFRLLQPHLKPGDVVLDVGCGMGAMVGVLKRAGYQAYGFAPDMGYASFGAQELNLPVSVAFIGRSPYDGMSFDFIMSFHVFEHLEDPVVSLARLCSQLRLGGKVLIEVPNVESVCSAPRQRFHRAHLYCFNEKTLTAIFNRVGLTPVWSRLSPDGANVCVLAEKRGASPLSTISLPGNCDRLRDIVGRHTPFRHFTQLTPYSRMWHKAARTVKESLSTRKATTPRSVYDRAFSLYLKDIADENHTGPG